ncbi:cytochrome P450 [Apiospora arundinis]
MPYFVGRPASLIHVKDFTLLLFNLLGAALGHGKYTFALFLVLTASYRHLLHPLRNYPGPLFAKLTDAYAGLFAVQERLHLVFLRLHGKYGMQMLETPLQGQHAFISITDDLSGSVIRPATNRLLFNSPSAFRAIYQNDDRITKSFTYEMMTRNGVYSVFNTLDRDLHRYKRQIAGQAFSPRSIRSFEPALQSQVDAYLEQILGSSGQPVNMIEKPGHLAADVFGQLALGYELATQTREENRFLPKFMKFSFFLASITHHIPPFYRVHTNWVFDYIFYNTREKFNRLLTKMVRSRLAMDTHAVPDFFSFVSEKLPSEAAKTRDSAIWEEALVFLAGGADSVTTAMAAAFFYLPRNPECYKRLADEIRTTFANSTDIRGGP